MEGILGMPDYRRAPRRLLAYLLAVPVIVLVYVGAFGTRVWAALRPAVATFLGATVIGSVYADEALKRAPATPMRAAAVLALVIALVGHGMAPAPTFAANDPAEAVIAAAREYLDHPFRMGAEGPKYFDCSGLVFRAFSDAGELPRIGGMRLLSRGYMRWFISRGLFTRDVDKAQRGDLVIWGMGEHIGIYLGGNKAISALINPWGISVHSLGGVRLDVDYFLLVNWRNGDGPGNPGPGDNPPPPDEPADPGAGPGNGNSTGSSDNGNNQPPDEPGNGPDNGNPPPDGNNGPPDEPQAIRGKQGITTGVLNMRSAADPDARIIGWLGRNKTFKILGTGKSPAGYLWYEAQTVSGKRGWIFSYWVREL
jgi:cell wall-associated NlpC family hydrolase